MKRPNNTRPSAARARRSIELAAPAAKPRGVTGPDEQAPQLSARLARFPDRATIMMLDAGGIQQYLAQFAKLQDDLSGAELSDAQRQQVKTYQADLSAAQTWIVEYHKDRSPTPEEFWTLDQVLAHGCRFNPEAGIEGVVKHLLLKLQTGETRAYSSGQELKPSYWSSYEIAFGDNGHWGAWKVRAPRTSAGALPNVRIRREEAVRIFSRPKASKDEILDVWKAHARPKMSQVDLFTLAKEHCVGDVTKYYFRRAYAVYGGEKRDRGERVTSRNETRSRAGVK
jgi:hypothetical protein